MDNANHPLASGVSNARCLFPTEIPENQKFYVGLPCYASQMTQPTVMGLIEAIQQSPFVGTLDFVTNDSLVCRARNTIAARFLESKSDWLMFIDVDLQIKVEHIARLWLHATKENRKIVCGIYAMKKLAPRFVANWINGEVPDKNGAVKVSESGTGCMVIHRSVFEAMIKKFPQIEYTTDFNHASGTRQEWDFFAVGPYKYESGLVRYLSEDWMFCQRARDIGIDVWADTKIQIRHMGNMVYPPEQSEMEEAVAGWLGMQAPGFHENLKKILAAYEAQLPKPPI